VRNMCAPYANMLIATESQKIAIAGACAEAIVNLSSSIYLARHIGAIGVAYGTLLGSFVGVGMHFLLNMHYTYAKFAITRRRLFLSGIARPLTIALPSIVLVKLWWQAAAPSFGLRVWLAWGLSSLLLAWFVGLDPAERASLLGLARSQSKWAGARINPVDPLG
jgi:O-antigen/teichoic acid export membrane protein